MQLKDFINYHVETIGPGDTLQEAAQKMRDLDVGALPICGEDDRLKGMLTDRDIVVRCIADGGDPTSVTAGSLAQGKPVTIGADDSAEEALRRLEEAAGTQFDPQVVDVCLRVLEAEPAPAG